MIKYQNSRNDALVSLITSSLSQLKDGNAQAASLPPPPPPGDWAPKWRHVVHVATATAAVAAFYSAKERELPTTRYLVMKGRRVIDGSPVQVIETETNLSLYLFTRSSTHM